MRYKQGDIVYVNCLHRDSLDLQKAEFVRKWPENGETWTAYQVELKGKRRRMLVRTVQKDGWYCLLYITSKDHEGLIPLGHIMSEWQASYLDPQRIECYPEHMITEKTHELNCIAMQWLAKRIDPILSRAHSHSRERII